MCLWTIQRRGWWEALRRRGVLYGDGRRVYRGHRGAYRWLMAQMRSRVSGCTERFPIWCWRDKPDLRRRGHLTPNERGVRVELALPHERVLLLDFETWHCVLNGWHLSLSWRESRAWDRKCKLFDPFRAPLSPELAAELEASWERVFEPDLLRAAGLWGPIDQLQAVTEYVRLGDVRRVEEFVAR